MKASPVNTSNRPSQKRRLPARVSEAAPKTVKLVLPDAAKSRAMPNTRNAAERPPMTRYLTPASRDAIRPRWKLTST